jgi:hypothetical protein
VYELGGGIAEHDPEESAASSASEREERGLELIALPAKDVYRFPTHDPCAAARSTLDHCLGRVSRFGCLLSEQLREVSRLKAGMDR